MAKVWRGFTGETDCFPLDEPVRIECPCGNRLYLDANDGPKECGVCKREYKTITYVTVLTCGGGNGEMCSRPPASGSTSIVGPGSYGSMNQTLRPVVSAD